MKMKLQLQEFRKHKVPALITNNLILIEKLEENFFNNRKESFRSRSFHVCTINRSFKLNRLGYFEAEDESNFKSVKIDEICFHNMLHSSETLSNKKLEKIAFALLRYRKLFSYLVQQVDSKSFRNEIERRVKIRI